MGRSHVPPSGAERPRANVAPARAAFVGRAAELGMLHAAIASGVRLVSLTGPAGAGKTTLARRYAAAARGAAWPGGVWFVDLADADARPTAVGWAGGAADVVERVARVLGVPLADGDPESAAARVGHALATQGALLLVLDNVEHVLAPGARAVREWLDRAPDLTVLGTSRERLGLAGEEVVELGSMPEADAVALFVARARAARRDFAADEADVRELVRKLDRLPLALELAAARVTVLSVEELSRRVEDRLDVLADAHDRGPRQLTMRHALEWSWDLLEPRLRSALAQASAFQGAFDARAAEAVLDVTDPLDAIQALRDKSLLASTGRDEPQLALYVVVRTFARERAAPDVTEPARARLAAYYAGVAADCAARIRGGRDAASDGLRELAALRRLEGERVEIRAAHAWGIRHDPELAATIVTSMAPLFLHRGPFAELETMATEVLALVPDAKTSSALLFARGAARRALGQMPAARADLEAAVRAATPGSLDEATALAGLGDVERSFGAYGPARDALLRAEDLARAHGDAELVGVAKRAYATLLLDQNRLEEAIEAATGACEAFRSAGSCLREGPARDLLGDIWSVAGDPERAIALHEEALAIHRSVDNRRAEAITQDHLASFLADVGRLDEALALGDQALARFGQLGCRFEAAHALWNQAMTLADAGHLARARARCDEALARTRAEGASRFEGVVLGWTAVLAWESDDLERAARFFAEAIASNAKMRIAREELTFRAYAAALAVSRDDFAAARARVEGEPSKAMLTAAFDVLEGLFAAAEGDLEVGRERLEQGRARAMRFAEVRPAIRLLARTVERAARPSGFAHRASSGGESFVVHEDGLWFEAAGGERVDLTRRRPLRLILRCLAARREAKPGVAVPIDEMVAAGWPGERILADAATARAYSAVRRLRDMGLRAVLRTTGDGYYLAPDVSVRVVPRGVTAADSLRR